MINLITLIKDYTKKTIFIIPVLIAGLFLLIKCDNGASQQYDEPIEYEGLVPLAVNNFWTYEKTNAFGTSIDTLSYNIVDSEIVELDGVRYKIYSRLVTYLYKDKWYPDNVKWFFRNGKDGYYHSGGETDSGKTIYDNILWLKYPVKKGDKWIAPNLQYNYLVEDFTYDSTQTWSCTDTNAVYQTPLGNFECYVYSYKMDLGDDVQANWDYFFFYSSGTGMVGWEAYSDLINRNLKEKAVLIDFSIQN